MTSSEKHYVGLYGAAKGWLVDELSSREKVNIVLCRNRKGAEELSADLQFFCRETVPLIFGGWETIPFESVSPQIDVMGQRIAVLRALLRRQPATIVITADGLLQRVPGRDLIAALTAELHAGQLISKEDVAAQFDLAGYQTVSLVEDVGEIAVHGTVIDVFPATLRNPVRLEFNGGLLAQLKSFDADSQRSLENMDSVVVPPVRESTPYAKHPAFRPFLPRAVERIKRRGRDLETPAREIASITGAIKSGTSFPGMELIDPLALAPLPTLFDYLDPSQEISIVDMLSLSQALDTAWENIIDREQRLSSEHYLIPHKEDLFLAPEEVLARIQNYPRHYLDHLEILSERERSGRQDTITVRSKANTELTTRLKTKVGTGHALAPLAKFINNLRRQDYHIAFAVGSPTRAEKLQRQLLEINFDARISSGDAGDWRRSRNRYPLVIIQGHLSAGFQLPEQRLALISENEVYAERSYRQSKPKTSLKRLLGTLAQLNEGDYVVHTDYGIGCYHGLKHLEVEGAESDFLHIEYADSRLYLPVHQIGKVQKFQAAEGQVPALDKLGSNKWIKTKQKVRESVATLAGDLIRLYAARAVVKGWRFDPAGAEDERFAEDFPYDETPDQLKAIEETLADMAEENPMDRLVCGDVGFGKTEVALRAAYKCAQHAKQVAVLVPTTILAEQHRQTFERRFSEMPVKIGAVSRFYSSQQNKETLQKLQEGQLDVVIGTHRLLSRDVVFRDLGLVIIDEEHRFGVKQKERLKALKKQVDVLTLTATPIPRTLHMSLLGLRDISVISTPPQDRRLIRTYIASYDEAIIKDSIVRELQRGGQCFYVHNRVEGIELICAGLRELIPEARFAFAHGQMSETQLEDIMQRFMDKEIDVLVTTTIIESGLDIPNANTIIINRADAFGLAQLYQLRGRVGRSTRQAYAYFLIPKSRKLGADAQERLKALQSLDDLGLGFNLAVRDLEIRGAGNLLGREQHGSVAAVGFELYTKILKEAILDLKGEEVEIKEAIEPDLKLGVSAFIPEAYIPDVSERLVLYQRFAGIDSHADADQLLEEIRDRYGPIPHETINLSELMRLRYLLRRYGVVKAEFSPRKLSLAFSHVAPIDAEKILKLTRKKDGLYKFSKNLTLTVTTGLEKLDGGPGPLFPLCEQVLQRIARSEEKKAAPQFNVKLRH